MSNSLRPHGLQPARLLCPWDSPGKNAVMGSHSLLWGIFRTRGSNQVSHIAGRFFTVWATKGETPGGASGKEHACQHRGCKRQAFDLWVGKIPWSRKWQSTPVFLPGKLHAQRRSLVGRGAWWATVCEATKSWTHLSIHTQPTQGP